jgi:hypothetical protein
MNNEYDKDYAYIYNASVIHDDLFNDGKLDDKFAHDFARTYFVIAHCKHSKEEFDPIECDKFMKGWFEYWQHMFD